MSTIPSCDLGRDGANDIPRRLIHSPREAEILLGLSHAGIYRLIAAGRLRAIKIGSRTGITRESIEAVATVPRGTEEAPSAAPPLRSYKRERQQ